jgi:hypothetical protein
MSDKPKTGWLARRREKRRLQRERRVDRARQRSEHQRGREKRGEVGQYKESDSGGFTSF